MGNLSNTKNITMELSANFFMMFRLSQYDFRLMNKDTYLGKIWSILTPLIQIGTYWFVFGVGIKHGNDVEGAPFLVWMLSGLIPWFFWSPAITRGADSVYSKAGIISKMRIPIVIIPTSAVLVEFFGHVMMLAVMMVMLAFFGYYPHWGWLNLIYFNIYSLFFLVSLSMITSVLSTIVRDFYKLLQQFMRLLFYLTPILWQMDQMPQIYQKIMLWNPVYYVVNGYRQSILHYEPFYVHWEMALFFWTVNIILYVYGCNLQTKFRNRFVDLL